jgi:hypothetical protein
MKQHGESLPTSTLLSIVRSATLYERFYIAKAGNYL